MDISPLQGLRVTDVTRTVAGMYCGRLLAEYGADVVRIETFLQADYPSVSDFASTYHSLVGEALNASKSRQASGPYDANRWPQSVRQAVSDARVLLEDLPPNGMEEFGVGYSDLRPLRPDLVYTSITPFGREIPRHVPRTVPDIVVDGLSGLMALTGTPDGPPLALGGSHGQILAGAYAALATLAACLGRRSVHIDLSVHQSMASVVFAQICDYSYRGIVSPRPTRIGTSEFFSARDGFVHGPLRPMHSTTAEDIAAFLSALPGEKVTRADVGDAKRIERLAAAKFASLDRAALVELAQSFRIAFSAVQRIDELSKCPQLAAYDMCQSSGNLSPESGRPFELTTLEGAAPPEGVDEDLDLTPHSSPRALPDDPPAPFLPLAGIRVLAAEQIYAGPIATYLLGALGAEVIRVESGDRPDGYPPTRGRRGSFNEVNRGKQGITLNLKSERGREIFMDLARETDVVVENYTKRVMSQFGLDFGRLGTANPRLVMVSSTGYGHGGPWANYKAYGPNLEYACGLSFLTGYADGLPVRPGGLAYGDLMAGLYGALAAVIGIFQRRRSGVGSYIDLSYYRIMVASLCHEVVAARVLGGTELSKAFQRNRSLHITPHGCYQCSGTDRWITLAVRNDDEWQALVSLMARDDSPQLANMSFAERWEATDEIDERIQRWTRSLDRDVLVGRLTGAGLAAGPVLEPYELLFHPVARERGFFEWIDHSPQGWNGVRPHLRPPWRFLGHALSQSVPAPANLGNDNERVLKGLLGYDDGTLMELEAAGVICMDSGPQVTEPEELPPSQMVELGRAKTFHPDFLERLGLPIDV